MTNRIAPHEAFELRELLTFKNICTTKAFAMAGLATDDKLKAILRADVELSKKLINDLQDLIQQSEFASGTETVTITGTATGNVNQ